MADMDGKRGRGRPAFSDEERQRRAAARDKRWAELTLDNPKLKTRKLTWKQINHLARQLRGQGLTWKKFQAWAALKYFPTYIDETRKSPKGEFVRCWLWPDVRGFLDGQIKKAS